jgi:hypothetical protein
MRAYLPAASDFTDMELLDRPDLVFTSYKPRGKFVLCPLCKGHGGWNLQRDAYGEGRHFRASCAQCNGYGWVDNYEPRDLECIHEYRENNSRAVELTGGKLFYQEHLWICKKCDRFMVVDSSG